MATIGHVATNWPNTTDLIHQAAIQTSQSIHDGVSEVLFFLLSPKIIKKCSYKERRLLSWRNAFSKKSRKNKYFRDSRYIYISYIYIYISHHQPHLPSFSLWKIPLISSNRFPIFRRRQIHIASYLGYQNDGPWKRCCFFFFNMAIFGICVKFHGGDRVITYRERRYSQ